MIGLLQPMIAEINHWSVTFCWEQGFDIQLLCKLYLVARECGIGFGSVNVATVVIPKTNEDIPVKPYLWIPHFDKSEVRAFLGLACIPLEAVTFEDIEIGKTELDLHSLKDELETED